MKLRVIALGTDATDLVDIFEIETDGWEVTSSGSLALYRATGPGAHQEIQEIFADGQWLRATRVDL